MLNSGHGGYFDGYIASITDWEEMSLTPNFDNILAIASGAAIQHHEPLKTIQRGSLALIQQLRYSNKILAWARVIVVERKDAAHAEVYFIDIGVRERVSVRSLYDMPTELQKFPPQVFPVRMFRTSTMPDLVRDEFHTLTQIRITVQIKSLDGSQFVCDHFTVYEAKSHGDIEIGEALRSGIEIERYNTTGALAFQYQHLDDGYHMKDAEMSVIESRVRKPIHLAVFLVFLLASLFLVTIFVAWKCERIKKNLLCPLNKRKITENTNVKGNDNQFEQSKGSQTSSPPQSWNTQVVCESNAQIPSNSDSKNRSESISEIPSQLKNEKVVLPLRPNAIASVAAIIGLSAAIKDKDLKNIYVTSQATNEQRVSDVNQPQKSNGQLEVGLSAISSIHPSSFYLPFVKATSSTPYHLPQTRVSNKDSPVSVIRTSFNSQDVITHGLPSNRSDYNNSFQNCTNTIEIQDMDSEECSGFQLPTYMDIEKMLLERNNIKTTECNMTQSTQNLCRSSNEDHDRTGLPTIADRNLTVDSFYSVYSNMLKPPKQSAAVVNLSPTYE